MFRLLFLLHFMIFVSHNGDVSPQSSCYTYNCGRLGYDTVQTGRMVTEYRRRKMPALSDGNQAYASKTWIPTYRIVRCHNREDRELSGPPGAITVPLRGYFHPSWLQNRTSTSSTSPSIFQFFLLARFSPALSYNRHNYFLKNGFSIHLN